MTSRSTWRALAPLLAAIALAGCSDERSPDAQPEPSPSAPASSAASASSTPSSGSTGSSPGGAGALTGQVSGLNSTVSGLNIRVTDFGTVIDLPADALFDFDSADLGPGAAEQLGKTAQVIRGAPEGAIRVVGHTDSKGDESYNQKLSEARARTVAGWLVQQVGVRQRSLAASGMGEREPVAPNQTSDGRDDPTGRARNRRVEVILPK